MLRNTLTVWTSPPSFFFTQWPNGSLVRGDTNFIVL